MKNIILIIFTICSMNVFSQELQKRVDTINILVQNGNYELALRKTNDIFNDGNEMSELYLLKAICLMEGNKLFVQNDSIYNVTMICLNKAIELDYMNHRAYGRRGLLNLTHKNFREAVNDYTKFISLTTDSLEIFIGLTDRGVAKIYSGDSKGAVEDYEKAIKYNPNDVSVYVNLGAIYIAKQNHEKANKVLKKGHKVFPKNTGILNNLGFLNIKMENYKKAKKYFNKVIKINNNDFLAYGNRGFCNLKLNKLDKSRSDLDRSIELKSDNSYVYMYNALYFLELKNNKKVCENLNKANYFGFSKMYGNEVNVLITKHCN